MFILLATSEFSGIDNNKVTRTSLRSGSVCTANYAVFAIDNPMAVTAYLALFLLIRRRHGPSSCPFPFRVLALQHLPVAPPSLSLWSFLLRARELCQALPAAL